MSTTRHARIELRPVQGSTKATQPHYLRLVAANGETLAHSEPYANRQNARRGAWAWFAAFGDVWMTAYGDSPVEFTAAGERR